MHAAGILRHVAADGAGDLAGGIGGIVEPFTGDGMADRQVRYAWLHHRAAVLQIDFEDAVELAHAEQHAVAQRQRATGQRSPGAAWDHLDAARAAIAQHRGNLIDRGRQHGDQW